MLDYLQGFWDMISQDIYEIKHNFFEIEKGETIRKVVSSIAVLHITKKKSMYSMLFQSCHPYFVQVTVRILAYACKKIQ